MKRKIVGISILVFVILTFVFSLSLMNKKNIETKELLAYVDTSDVKTVLTMPEETTTTTEEVTTTVETTTTTITTTKALATKTEVTGIGEIKGNVDQRYLNLLNTELNKLPSKALTRFKNSGWHIYVTDENIAKTVFNGKYKSVQGVTIYSDKTILIEARDVAIKESTIHEFGHFIDYMKDFTSDSKEFKKIYAEEVNIFKSGIVNSSCVRDEQEFFAETLYYIYKNPSKCTEKAYEYVNNIINNF